VFFNEGCIKQVFSPNSEKKNGADPSYREKRRTLIPKKTSPSRRLEG